MKTIVKFFSSINLGKAALLVVSPLILFWQSMGGMIIGLGFLIFIDLVMGIRADLKQKDLDFKFLRVNTWKNIESDGLKRTANKAKDYAFLIIGAFVLSQYMLKGCFEILDFGIDEITAALLGAIELWSIGENFRKLRGYNILEYVAKFFKSKDISKAFEDVKNAEKKD